MATDKQIAANRANALSSTGPRSLTGKARSSLNAVQHGLTSEHAMLPGENIEEFRGLRSAMFCSLKPDGAMENQLIERAVSLMWRLRRFPVFETALFQWTSHYMTQIYDDPIEAATTEGRNMMFDDEPASCADLKDSLRLGRVLEALLSSDTTSKLSRYERDIQRQLNMTLKTLSELQIARAALTAARASEAALAGDNDDYGYLERGRKRRR